MSARVNLIWLGAREGAPGWPLGDVSAAEATPASVAACVAERARPGAAEACLFWDGAIGTPDPATVERALERPGDAWHAGLRLGTAGQPGLIDFVAPTWMLNSDPDLDIEATSWRVSLRACLVRSEVLLRLGGPSGNFRSLDGAALEMGHRWVKRGALTRHVPWLAPEAAGVVRLPPEDEVRFAYRRFGAFWTRWALARAVSSGYLGAREALQAWRAVVAETRLEEPDVLHENGAPTAAGSRVSVVIPTLDRYRYLKVVLRQLEEQTCPPYEVIVVDQTPLERREASLAAEFPGLPLRVLHQEEPGQCGSRNAALEAAGGDCVLFLDDDDEIPGDLIESHLANLERFRAEVSCGVAHEAGAGPLPEGFRYVRASDVFPTNNSLVRRSALRRSGLFDYAYNRGSRADGDLGMRLYRSGALMVLNPSIAVLHHHAPRGGLRSHQARVITYASSRRRLLVRHLPAATEIYLARRYFTPRQVREMLWMRAFGTLSLHGSLWKRVLKAGIGVVCLPWTGWQIARQYQSAARMLERFPRIPVLN
jgi:glycosyltransferase involved in cell wall biosynthesis